jgi:hypothetical protein
MDCNEVIINASKKFTKTEATRALVHSHPDTKRGLSRWLSDELRKVRDGEKIVGRAPVLRREALSRLTIADIALTMLECLEEQVGENLICLTQELLDVDRHRSALADARTEAFENAAAIEGQSAASGKSIGVRQMARLVSVNPSTVTAWRRREDYKKSVNRWREMASRPEFQKLINQYRR